MVASMHAHRITEALKARGVPLLPFHRKWVKAAFAPDIQIAALSVPRGSAKTFLAGNLAAVSLIPGSPLFQKRVEVLAVSASLEQSRILLSFVREALVDVEDDYRWLDSGQRLQVTHKATGTKLRILSSSGKRALGLANFSTIYADEPASWEERGGALMWDALRQSLGKRGGQRLVLIGTRAPAPPAGWWPALLDAGSGPGTHVTVLSAPMEEPWDRWETIRRVNPMVLANPHLRKTILRERDDARRNPSLRPSFEAFRLNRQVDVSNEVLVDAALWKTVEGREVPPREGRPILALDLGSERSWTGAWLLYRNGRSECYAVCPGIPDLAERERQDSMPVGLYRKLYDDGVLIVDEGRRVSDPSTLVAHIDALGVKPKVVLADRFMVGRLRDAVGGRWPIVERVVQWSSATEDITAFRGLVLDGPMSIVPECRALARVSLSQAIVEWDRQGSCRLHKRRHSRSRDDVAVCATLAAGRLVRAMSKPKRNVRWYQGMV